VRDTNFSFLHVPCLQFVMSLKQFYKSNTIQLELSMSYPSFFSKSNTPMILISFISTLHSQTIKRTCFNQLPFYLVLLSIDYIIISFSTCFIFFHFLSSLFSKTRVLMYTKFAVVATSTLNEILLSHP
jgi:hypothetical protein